jgi:hypothetical protein
LRVLTALRCPALLISAYDIFRLNQEDRTAVEILLSQCAKEGKTILMDSGKYESYWKADDSWKREHFHSVLARNSAPFAFSFDNQFPADDPDAVTNEVERSVLQDQAQSKSTILPIIHCQKDVLPQVVYEVARRLRPLMVAVPERILGDGVLERIRTVTRIRASLVRLDYYCPLRLLGTGNPLSILVYVASGAESFDGLEWCQTTVDQTTALLFHFQQWDFFASQTDLGKLNDVPYTQKVLCHNLIFYENWMAKIRSALLTDTYSQLLAKHLPKEAHDMICREISGLS